MQTFAVVMPEHLNQRGFLFGGVLLSWVDKYAWLAASWEYPGCDFVTVSVDEAVFRHPVVNGAILRFEMKKTRIGKSSLTYEVEVFARAPGEVEQIKVFTTSVVLVRMGEDGCKKAISE